MSEVKLHPIHVSSKTELNLLDLKDVGSLRLTFSKCNGSTHFFHNADECTVIQIEQKEAI